MMTLSRISPLDHRPINTLPGLRVSAYERAASWLLAWLLLTSAVALCLFVVWLGLHGISPTYQAASVNLLPMGGTGGQGESGQDLSLAWPTADAAAAESDLNEPVFEPLLKTIIAVAATRAAQFDEESSIEDKPQGRDRKKGTVEATGGGEGNGPVGMPPHLRWEIDWGGADTLETYARKLDFFGIELGTYGLPSPGQVTYISRLSRPRPDVRVGASKADQRLYMSWRGGARQAADRGLAAKAGVSPVTILLQFFPPETEELLLKVEQAYGHRAAATIRKTRFGVRSAGKEYEFFVVEQRYL